jgi:hypothetical protein
LSGKDSYDFVRVEDQLQLPPLSLPVLVWKGLLCLCKS